MPLALGRDVIGLAPNESTIASVLHESGYATGAFSAANPYISARFGYDQGFEVFRDFADFGAQPGGETVAPESSGEKSLRGGLNRSVENLAGVLGLSQLYNELYFRYRMRVTPAAGGVEALRRYPAADVLVDQAEAWLASIGPRPFFLWIHLMDPHAPYYPPNEAFRELTGREIDPGRARYLNEYWNRSDLTPSGLSGKRDEVVQLYDAGIRWVDHQIARLIDRLKKTYLWDDCVFALTADHGEEFLEHSGRYHSPVRLNEEVVRVPLLIRVPGGKRLKGPASPMSHVHLAPTLLDILGVEAPRAFRGRSLWANLRSGAPWDEPAIIECAYGCANPFRAETRNVPRLLGVRDARFKLVMRIESGAVEEIYDLEADPGETRPNQSGVAPEIRKRLLQAALEHIEKTASAQDGMLRLRARLRDLRSEGSDRSYSARM
jgi:arylsulfatase A-like enzyme